jgi:hypothetical protein
MTAAAGSYAFENGYASRADLAVRHHEAGKFRG